MNECRSGKNTEIVKLREAKGQKKLSKEKHRNNHNYESLWFANLVKIHVRVDKVFSRLQHVLWETLSICSRRFSLLRNLVAQLVLLNNCFVHTPHSPPVFENAHKTQTMKTPF